MLSEIKNRYTQSLKRSESFLKTKKTAARSSSITSSREICLLRNQAECPICATKFMGKNHNTEHIHPRALGGLNNDENKIQMCTACNNSRNLTMQSMLGNPPYYKNYQKIKTDVDEFILWSEVTADDGLQAGSFFPRAQEIFTETRFANNEPPAPERSYGRFSTWDTDDPPNLNLNKKQSKNINSKSKFIPRKPGIITRFFDWVFDYQPTKPEGSSNNHNSKTDNNSNRIDDGVPVENGLKSVHSRNKKSVSSNIIKQRLGEGEYPLITHLNSSSSGLRFPREPRQFALCMEWFIENVMKFTTFDECHEGLKESGIIPKSRAWAVLVNILHAYTPNGTLDSLIEEDLGKEKNLVVHGILENLSTTLTDQTKMSYIVERENFFQEIEKYFHNVNREFGKGHENEIFPLIQWLQLNWKDESSYPLLRKAINNFEAEKGSERNYRDILREDLEIPKSWPVVKIINKITHLKNESSD